MTDLSTFETFINILETPTTPDQAITAWRKEHLPNPTPRPPAPIIALPAPDIPGGLRTFDMSGDYDPFNTEESKRWERVLAVFVFGFIGGLCVIIWLFTGGWEWLMRMLG